MNVDRINSLLSLLREDFLKGVSYVFIFMTWVEERNNNQLQKERWFSLYQKMYHARRLFRISSWIVYGPMIRDLIYMLQEKLTFKAVFALLGSYIIIQATFSQLFFCSSTIFQWLWWWQAIKASVQSGEYHILYFLSASFGVLSKWRFAWKTALTNSHNLKNSYKTWLLFSF